MYQLWHLPRGWKRKTEASLGTIKGGSGLLSTKGPRQDEDKKHILVRPEPLTRRPAPRPQPSPTHQLLTRLRTALAEPGKATR